MYECYGLCADHIMRINCILIVYIINNNKLFIHPDECYSIVCVLAVEGKCYWLDGIAGLIENCLGF